MHHYVYAANVVPIRAVVTPTKNITGNINTEHAEVM
jgi:hypothetical protein